MVGPGMNDWEQAELEAMDRACKAMEAFTGLRVQIIRAPKPAQVKHDALVDIAYDCATLEAAQRRAKEALKH